MLALLLTLLLPLQSAYTFFTNSNSGGLSPHQVIVNTIVVEGNQKTKEYIILRELDIVSGDTLDLTKKEELLVKNRNKIFNTNLFNTVELSIQNIENQRVFLLISVTERWYVFPMIILELADRNFNEWWHDHDRDLGRINYGFKLVHKNFRGRREEIRTTAQFGFTKRFELGYFIPYLDRARKHGIGFDIGYAQNKTLAYQTDAHKLTFLSSENSLRNRFYAGVRLTRRNKFYFFHTLDAKYNHNTIADTIGRLNPNYFLNGRTSQQYVRLSYEFTYDRRDNVGYPLSGEYFSFELARSGITPKEDFRQTSLFADYSIYRPLSKKYFWTASLRGKTSSPNMQPYSNYRGFGYGQDYVRGYEYYVIDGQHYGLAKLTFKRELIKGQKSFPSLIPLPQFQTIPFALYLKVYGDAGYVRDPQNFSESNTLSNTMLYSGGIGLDFVTFYNNVIRIDYTINRSLQRGFFIHFVKDI